MLRQWSEYAPASIFVDPLTPKVFWIVGFVVGAAIVAMTGKSFVEERGRRLIPLVVALAVAGGLVVGWALNAWNDYIHFTANGGGGGM